MATSASSEHDPDINKESPVNDAELESALEDWESATQHEETTLMQLRQSVSSLSLHEPFTDPASRLHQLRIIQSALESLSAADPHLPTPSSPLPALLALRTAQLVSRETRESMETLHGQLRLTRIRLEKEQADLRDGRLITAGLERRIEQLQQEELQLAHTPLDQVATDLIQRLRQRHRSYDREVKRLIKAFNAFIENHLAAMLATEEAGGPIVGQLLDVDPDALGTKRGKKGADRDNDHADPLSSAGSELRELTEELMNASVAAEGNSAQAYVTLQRDSAAARFLVRAKIAQFAPRDARRIRLIDFGKRLDEQ